jgi:hypothetical protein
MWTWLASLITGPVIKGVIDGYKAKLAAGNTSEHIAADLAARELEVQRRETEVEAEYKRALIGRWYEPTNLFGYIMVIYFGKIIVWDKVLKLGVTDSITGQGAEWAGWIMMFYVGKRGFENVARILRK